MFLFSTPNRAQPKPAEHPLAQPLRQASEATGIPFDYLIKTAKRESNLNPEAKAASSSATGLFQFIEQTWLGLVKREGAKLGIGNAADAIVKDGGRYAVPDAEARAQILAMRKDPTLSARLAGIFTSDNKASLKEAFGREPSGGELYIAHFMGAGGARELISLASSDPDRSAASAFPDAASANRSIFFDPKGRARSAREVYARLVSFHDGADAVMPPTTAVAAAGSGGAGSSPPEMVTRSPLAIAPGAAANGAAAVNGFFRGGGQGQAASALRKTWIGIAENRLNPNAPSFFPRAETVKVAALTPEAVAAVTDAASDAAKVSGSPLAGFTAKAEDTKVEAVKPDEPKPVYEAVNLPVPPRRPAHLDQPLDLTRIAAKARR
jgi:hypothetical protein